MKNQIHTLDILLVLIILFSTFACYMGLFYNTGGKPFEFTSIRGETVEIYGDGIYKFDSKSIVAQAKAQDAVTLFLGIPLLVFSWILFRKNSIKGKLLLTGTLAYFLYTYISYTFLSAYNELFLIYVTLYSICLFAFILSIRTINISALPELYSNKFPKVTIAVFLMFVGFSITMMWMGRIVPPLLKGRPPAGLESYTTLPIQAMDLGLVVPVSVLAAILLLKAKPWGFLLASIILIKAVTLTAAIDAMIIAQLMAGFKLNIAELVLFPTFTVFTIILTIFLFKHISNEKTEQDNG